MNRCEFTKYIESVGFINITSNLYAYKKYTIRVWFDNYNFNINSELIHDNVLNDLTLVEIYLKKELRSIKLKKMLG